MKKKILALILGLSLLLVACGDKTGVDSGSASRNQDSKNWFSQLETRDLDGEEVTSDIFEENDINLINVWATWCGPCVDELQDLGELAREYEGKGVGIKGILVEMDRNKMNTGLSEEERKIAEDIISQTRADYQHLLVSEDLLETKFSRIIAFPTTYFVDSKGEFVGKEISGAKSKEEWDLIINERLEMLKNE